MTRSAGQAGRIGPCGLLLAVGLGSCAPAPPAEAPAAQPAAALSPAAEAGPSTGTVLGLRPVPPPEARPGEWRGRAAATVLAVATPGDAFRGQPMEIVIRLDRTNRDTAIVQPNEAGLRPGDRVAVTFGERARLTRASGARPAGTISVENEPEG